MTLTSTPRVARSVEHLETETAFAVLARARELERLGRSIVHLEIGQPAFPTPEHVVEAATGATGAARRVTRRALGPRSLERSWLMRWPRPVGSTSPPTECSSPKARSCCCS